MTYLIYSGTFQFGPQTIYIPLVDYVWYTFEGLYYTLIK